MYPSLSTARPSRIRFFWQAALVFGLLGSPLGASAADTDARAQFERDIRPLLDKHCFGCHGPEKQKSDLRLDTLEHMLKGGSRGAAVVAGDDHSLLLEAIRQTGELKMPPDGPLPTSDIEKLSAWIGAGANWPVYESASADKTESMLETRASHWAYQPLTPEAPPKTNSDWARNKIDRYVAAKMAAAGLQPSPEADRRTLIRRLSYDLTGLPPTPEEVDAFVADTRPDAVELLVDRLLASPRYGERWGRHWLDVVRYTDSYDSRGNDKTDPVEIWRYRDWVINALNDDMPYDAFVRNQIAGDVLPAPDGGFNRDGLIATGMLAIGPWPQGDADKEKMVTDIVDDQVDVVTRAFLGVTMACARCHDHKFDPFSTEDYYGLAGIFFSSSILPGPGMKTEGSPILHLPLASAEDVAERRAAEERLTARTAERETMVAQARAEFAREHLAMTGQYLLADGPALDDGVLVNWQRALEGAVTPALHQVTDPFQQRPGLTSRSDAESTPSSVGNATNDDVKYATITQPARSVVVHPGPTEPVGVGWRAPVAAIITIGGGLVDADANCGNGITWSIVYREQGLERVLASSEFDNGGAAEFNVVTPVPVTPGGQILVTVTPRGDYACDTTRIDIQIASDTGQTWDFAAEVLPDFAGGNPWPDSAGNPDVWWLYRGTAESHLDGVLFAPWWTARRAIEAGHRDATALNEAAAAIQAAVSAALADETSPLAPALARLSAPGGPVYVEMPPAPEGSPLAVLNAEIAALQRQLAEPLELAVGIQEGGVPTTPYEGFHDVRVHRRGEYTNLGDVVPRQMPPIIPGTEAHPVTQGSGRAELAAWITGDCAPLLARVMVNRVWQHHFGEGLVRTPGDFGAQGQPPTHPELLDHLAAHFIESGWRLKDLHRAILNTATYRQASGAGPDLRRADPENQWLARMNRRRLDAEALRDSLLAVTGRLDPTPGGPAFVDLATPRRTLYYRTTRSNLNTYTQLFDGADPTSIVPARNESIVSPQALFLMNDPLSLAAAEALIAAVGDGPLPARIEGMYRRAFNRQPTAEEIHFAETTLHQLGHPEDPTALTAYAQVLLCSNEFCFVD